MGAKRGSSAPLGLAVILFLIGVVGSLLTATTALIVWLSAWLGVVGASLVICLLCLVTALLSYLLALRGAMRRLDERFDTVSRVASLILNGYDWLLHQSAGLLRLFEQMFKRA